MVCSAVGDSIAVEKESGEYIVVSSSRLEDFKGKRVAVLGMQRTGCAAASVLLQQGADVLACDEKELGQLNMRESVEALRARGVEIQLGAGAFDLLDDCDMVVTSPGIHLHRPSFRGLRAAEVPFISEVELAYRLCPCPVVAVSGTNGKTTTASLIHEILKAGGRESLLCGNIGKPFVSSVEELTSEHIVVLEVSSFQLATCITFRPHLAVLLNVATDHLDWHASRDEYVEAKARLFSEQNATDWAILNADDPTTRGLAGEGGARVFWFGFELDRRCAHCRWWTGVKNDRLVGSLEGLSLDVCSLGEFQLLGRHNVSNLMAAVGAGLLLDVSPDDIRAAVQSFRGVEHRMELVDTVDGVVYVNDSAATTPHACASALATLTQPIILIAGGRSKGANLRTLTAPMRECVKGLIAVGESAQEFAEVARAAGVQRVCFADSMTSAVKSAVEMAVSGDSVLLSPACASLDMFSDYTDRGMKFKDMVSRLTSGKGAM